LLQSYACIAVVQPTREFPALNLTILRYQWSTHCLIFEKINANSECQDTLQPFAMSSSLLRLYVSVGPYHRLACFLNYILRCVHIV